MEATAKARFVGIPARKMRLVVDVIRGKNVEDALKTLHLIQKGAAMRVEKTLHSAVANAMNVHGDSIKDPGDLYITEAVVDEGPTLKRILPRAMGRASRILKRSCHLRIVVGTHAGEQ